MEGLSIVDDGDEGLVLQAEPEYSRGINLQLFLIGRFLTDRDICTNMMKMRMASIWRSRKGVSITETEKRPILIPVLPCL